MPGPVHPGPDTDLSGSELLLSDEDSHHALKALRLGEEDECEVVVGACAYAAVVSEAVAPVRVKLTGRLGEGEAGSGYRIRVGVVQALVRPSLVDYVLEKGTEVGASFFLLVQAAGSPRWSDPSRGDRLTRWRRIVCEAAKQSKQLVIPVVEVAHSIEHALRYLGGSGVVSLRLEPSATVGLQQILGRPGGGSSDIALWVGPEGGWAPTEREQLMGAGVQPARLGRSILRTETAGPVAVAVARLTLRDW